MIHFHMPPLASRVPRPATPPREPHTLDFRQSRWGHSLETSGTASQDGQLRGHLWSTPRPTVGDYLAWRAAHGDVVAEVMTVELCRDPSDMAFFTACVIWRQAEGLPLPAGVTL